MPKDFIELLTEDHRKVTDLIDRFENSDDGDERRRLFDEIDRELRVHTQVEEEIVYPAIRDAGDEALGDKLDEGKEEHEEAEDLLDRLQAEDLASESADALIQALEDAVSHHIEEEEDDLFARCLDLFSRNERQTIGDQALLRKRQLLQEDLEALRAL